MTGLALKIKHSCPGLWRLVERVNGRITSKFLRGKQQEIQSVLAAHSTQTTVYSLVEPDDLENLSRFLNGFGEEQLVYFHPHGFDLPTLERLFSQGGFLLMKVETDNRLAGYFFLRLFLNRRAFAGLIVDEKQRGKGIGRHIWQIAFEICEIIGCSMFATINRENEASLGSIGNGLEYMVVEKLPHDYLLVKGTGIKK